LGLIDDPDSFPDFDSHIIVDVLPPEPLDLPVRLLATVFDGIEHSKVIAAHHKISLNNHLSASIERIARSTSFCLEHSFCIPDSLTIPQ
jgi:hypothetical protein